MNKRRPSEMHQIFGLDMPAKLPTEAELQAMTRPLSFCSTCRYVLCSCGNCHNTLECNEVCLKGTENSEGES
jgi:hypothetical protein